MQILNIYLIKSSTDNFDGEICIELVLTNSGPIPYHHAKTLLPCKNSRESSIIKKEKISGD